MTNNYVKAHGVVEDSEDYSVKDIKLTTDDLVNVLVELSRSLEGIEVNPERVRINIRVNHISARKNPKLFREVRHDLLSSRMNLVNYDYDEHPLFKTVREFGYRSIITHTISRLVSCVKLSDRQLEAYKKKLIMSNSTIPPAFDYGLMSTRECRYNAYEILEDYKNIPMLRKMINELSQIRKDHLRRVGNGKKFVVLLDNISGQGWCSGSVNVDDFMANLYVHSFRQESTEYFEEGTNIDYRVLANHFGLKNNRGDSDPFVYISKEDVYDGHDFDVILLPDKDGKVRLIYRGSSQIQTISKLMHLLFDEAAKKAPGNYTYDQREWVRNIVRENWHRTKYIIGTDIEKFSDTMHRKWILAILEKAGFTEDELRELDNLYSCKVRNWTGEILSDTLATYQGQYGDFPLITMGNLAIQYMVYHVLETNFIKGYNAAVGDDTGFIFDRFIPEAMSVIMDLYGSAGMNINLEKTGELFYNNGDISEDIIAERGIEEADRILRGVVEFTKIRFDKDGIIPFIEPKSFVNNDIDLCVRDMYNAISDGIIKQDLIENMMVIIFNKRIKDMLMDISIINGGINMRPIEERDVDDLVNSRITLMDLSRFKSGGFFEWLNQSYRDLLDSGYTWEQTVFRHLVNDDKVAEIDAQFQELYDEGEITEGQYHGRLNHAIMAEMCKVAQLGSKFDVKEFRGLIGMDPKEIYDNYKRFKKDHKDKTVNDELLNMYRMIKDNDNWLGRLKKKKDKDGSLTNVYKQKMLNLYASSEDSINGVIKITSKMDIKRLSGGVGIMGDTAGEVMEDILDLARTDQALVIVSTLRDRGILKAHGNGYGTFWHVVLPDGSKRRLYNNIVNMKHPLLTVEEKRNLGIRDDLDLQELIELYNQFV